jgi:hypothetical protein
VGVVWHLENVSYIWKVKWGEWKRYVPPERGKVGVVVATTGLEGRVQSAAATAGRGVAAES